VSAVRKALLAWYRQHRRDLPWRRTRDPYAIWVSETMLQQTRVETVVGYYQRFLERFPNPHALARAESDDVLGAWAGLGYYGRARNLQAAARQVVENHGGELPDDVEALRALKGVGRYTAGAIASIAFDRPAPIVDGNVARVLTRLLGIREDVQSTPVVKRLWEEADVLARGESPGDLNQALMELGATLCTPRSPRCDTCPIANPCRARQAGDPESIPVKRTKPKPKRVEAIAAFVERRGKALAVRRPPNGLLGGLWELPGGELRSRERPDEGLVRSLRERIGLSVSDLERLGTVRHVFTHRVLRLHVYRAGGVRGRVRLEGFDAHRWLPPAALADLPQSRVMEKALHLVARS
jgi:A/G-specific adenine glycosylase